MFVFLDEYLLFSRENGNLSSEKNGGSAPKRRETLENIFLVSEKIKKKTATHNIISTYTEFTFTEEQLRHHTPCGVTFPFLIHLGIALHNSSNSAFC